MFWSILGLLLIANGIAVWYLNRSAAAPSEPLGIPRGSVRALLALNFVFIVALYAFYTKTLPSELLTILSAIVGYYFGSRTKSVPQKTYQSQTIASGAKLFSWHSEHAALDVKGTDSGLVVVIKIYKKAHAMSPER